MQTDLYIIILWLSILFTSSCNNQLEKATDSEITKVVDTLSFEEVERSIKEEQQAEIYKIEKKAVIFFMIDRQEAKKLAHELGDSYRWETDMLFKGFLNQSKEFGRLVRKHNIKSELIHSTKFSIILNNGKAVILIEKKKIR